MIDLVHWG